MVNDLKIKKYWIITLCMVFCSLASFAQECTDSWNRSGEIYFKNDVYGDPKGTLINTGVNITYGKYGNPISGLTYEWKLYDANGTLLNSGNNINFPILLTKAEDYKVTVKVTNSQGCSYTEKTITGRDPNACIVPAEDRFQGSFRIETYWQGIPLHVETPMVLSNPSGYDSSKFTFKWKLYNAAGSLITTGTQPSFPVTFTSIEEYRIELEAKDLRGCITNLTQLVTPIEPCIYNSGERSGYIATDKSPYDNGLEIYANESNNLSFYSYGKPAEDFTYKWELFNPKGVSISTSEEASFPMTLPSGGEYELHLKITDPSNGCETDMVQGIVCLITDSCTNDNPKSQKVKALYEDLLVNLISRSIQGETDAQINASAPTAEFTALKPYITNGPKDKIYNYVSTARPDEGGTIEITEVRFSFSPGRDYDVNALLGWGISYDSKKTSIANLQTAIRDSLYTDLGQYMTSEQFITSCKSRYSGGDKMSKKKDGYDLEYCDFGSQIRHIDFCPGTGVTCDPAIIGFIDSRSQTVFTHEDVPFKFTTTVTNLTYSWAVALESGEIINTSDPDITVPYIYKFKYEGTYFVTVTAKDPTGCSKTFSRLISVRDTHCENMPYTFKFETADTILNYEWKATDTSGHIVNTQSNTNGTYTFTPTEAGNYEISLATTNAENCVTVFSKYVQITSCGGNPVSCTENSPMTPKVHTLFINLINKLVSTPNGTNVNSYARNEIIALASYTTSSRARIFNFVNTNTAVSFSFTQNGASNDVFLPKSASGTISGIDLSKYFGSQQTTQVITNYSDGSNNPADGFVRNIDFCPAADCLPAIGQMTIIPSNGASKSSTGNRSKI